MKKTLLATAIAGAMVYGATAAQAATVYDQDGTQVDVYGRINIAAQTGGPETGGSKASGSEIINNGSRFGFRARNEVSSDLSVFANAEFRFAADTRADQTLQTRSTFVGLDSDSMGRVTVGNFLSVYYTAVGSVFDVPQGPNAAVMMDGFGAVNSQADSIAYSTPNLEGFQAHVQAQHYSGNNAPIGVEDNSSTTSWIGAVNYTWENLYLGLGYVQSKDLSERGASADFGERLNQEDLWGATASYQFTPEFAARIKYEDWSTNADLDLPEGVVDGRVDNLWGLGGTFDYGMGNIYADYYRVRMVDEDQSSRNHWVLGATYRFSTPMFAYFEVVDFDFDTDQAIADVNDDLEFTVGLRYDF
ncbi:porin [Halomonas chromatireducens]|uniref:Outer membrane pore protein E n=1 Tax=Halomonas chromatireducens TaxID=507626 RepID=A0A0X8HBN5_9GAMM|nr:porin [Halomonas chromatireducens]AMC99634.1 Outer membrane pore protein E precursor [Halomonas chromatireducens]